jgi:diguanylate cyclase (GGDEF)-like protein/PAS domain S-box-containing protein
VVAESSLVSDGQPERTFEAVLAQYPAARLSALTSDGTPVAVPPEIPVGAGHMLSGTAGMKAYMPHDRPALIDAFDEVMRTGYACANVHTLHDPKHTLTIHMFDTLRTYGVLLVVGVSAPNQDPVRLIAPRPQPPVRSRLARVYKSRTAEILGMDRATTDILGWSGEDMVGKRSLEFIHPDDQGLAIESWAVLVTEPDAIRRVRIRHRSKVGDWVWFDVAHSASVWQGQPCFVADMIDVSQEMETQRALEAREQLLAQLAEALPLGVFQIDAAHCLLYTNDCLFQMMGTRGASDFDALLERVVPADKVLLRDALLVVLSDGTDAELSVRVEPLDAPPRVCQFTFRRLDSATTALPGAVGCVVDTTDQTAMRRELEHRATYDSLTGCFNRGSIMTQLERTLSSETSEAARALTAVLFIDLDRFKTINDRFGHQVGDEFLVAAAARIRSCLRDDAALGRLGGDEFLVVLPDIESEAVAMLVAQRVADSLNHDVALSIGNEPCRASIGLAIYTAAIPSAEALVIDADTAMYVAKARGGGQVASASTIRAEAG